MQSSIKKTLRLVKNVPTARLVPSANDCCVLRSRTYSCLWSTSKTLSTRNDYLQQQQLLKPHYLVRLPLGTQRLASNVVGATESSSFLFNFWQTLSNSTPVAYVQQGLIEIHDTTGLPWWATIVLSTIVFRSLITLPLAIYQNKITARIENITLEMPALVTELKREAAIAMRQFKWTEKHTRLVYNRSLKQQWNKLIVRDNCHPAKTMILLWFQIPLWICQSVALRNLIQMLPDPNTLQAKLIFTELTIGGFGWIPNLTEVDSSYILPVTLGALNLIIVEIQSMQRKRAPTRLQNLATNAFRVLSLVMVPIACTVPSALCVYWVASSSYGLAQNLLLLQPKVRRAVGIPKTNSEFAHPYEHIWTTIKIRTGQIKAKPASESNATKQTKWTDSSSTEVDAAKSKKNEINKFSKS